MKEEKVNGKTYRLPNNLNPFQKKMYIHLIDWKWKNITKTPGIAKYKGKSIFYDAILPVDIVNQFPLIYSHILVDINNHNETYPFKLHKYFNHMASSQAAAINLFLPLLLLSSSPEKLMQKIKPDFKKLAKNELYKGFRIEFWDRNSNKNKGILGDHNATTGTDADIAIAYYNQDNELCLWLIEHKLTEMEFTTCGGYKSSKNLSKGSCKNDFNTILRNKKLCHYHSVNKYKYWELTDKYKFFFKNISTKKDCPFRNGLNQLWRNQLMALAIENDKSNQYKHVCFSVVHHPDNNYLNSSMKEYNKLINQNNKFFIFTSKDVIDSAILANNVNITKWINWYKNIYKL